jgi:4-methylaminobutanoate oxidase (formaldehyde-forming)
MMFHAEPVWRNGKRAGYVRAASYGFTLGGAVGLAMIEGHGEVVDQAWLDAGKYEVEIAGKRWPAIVSLKPLYDPEMKKIKA